MYLSITGVTADKKLAKYQPFDLEADANTHAAEYGGFVVEDPGGNYEFWTVDASAKTVTHDVDAEAAAILSSNWATLREERDRLLVETDWYAYSDVTMPNDMKTYRKALRDLPANTADPTDVTWPTKPS